MPRKTHKSTTLNRECDDVEEMTFAQTMESRHVLPSRTTVFGRRVWTF